jgi:predicted GIY-YIG superfamily endonuclease
MDNSIQKTTLYRYFDSEGQLLYVGITGDNTKRQSQHRRNSFWFGEIHSATFEHFDTRQEALDAESEAIRYENPKHNIVRGSFQIVHSPYTHLLHLAGYPDGGHDQTHYEFSEHYRALFQSVNGSMPTGDSVISFAMHFTFVKYPDLPNFSKCELCQRAMQSEWYQQGLVDMKRGKK